MKVLSTSWMMYRFQDEESPELRRDGGSIMIHDICEYIGRKVESYLYLGNECTHGFYDKNIQILDNSKYLPEKRSKDNIEEWQEALKKRFVEILKELKPDYVLVHGGIEFSTNCMNACIENQVPFSYVNHLMQSGNAGYKTNFKLQEWEKSVFNLEGIHVITVGNGMRDKLVLENPQLSSEQIISIPNGIPFVCNNKTNDTRSLNSSKKKRLLCVGSIQPRKNQSQLVKAFCALPKELQNKIEIGIIGNNRTNKEYFEELESEIHNHKLEKSIVYYGELPRDEMDKYYSNSDGLIMPSFSEGLSLVALEMLSYGRPVIMFRDNETAGDIRDNRVAVYAKEHTDEALAIAIEDWYNREWDEQYIKKYVSYYDMERVADDYIRYIKDAIKKEL